MKEALSISERIDEDLRRESSRLRDAKRREVKVMLLGQAESGKSTLQKQFQLLYSSKSLDVERMSWVPAVYLNIIKALRIIFAELEYEATLQIPDEPLSSPDTREALDALRMRLLPFVAFENLLAAELSGGVSVGGGKTGAFVRSGWQSRIVPPWKFSSESNDKPATPDRTRELTVLVARTLAVAVDDIECLWAHEGLQFYIRHRKIPLDDSASFFLGNIQRIAEPEYCPTNDDILHVRLQTLGVMEHKFPVSLAGRTYQWKMYDVGGARGQRQTWVPFFDDATAIIFLAPVSAFDQYLEEDPKVNRVDDSLQLWTSICSNNLLKSANLVLLLNKIDLLREKLEAGVAVRKYITSYGDRPNNFETVADYFRGHFLQVHRKKDTTKRPLYVHFTSMLDVKATQSIIANVGEAIVRKHISQIGLM
ncbi:G-protein alpha subunit [Crepidotus variabilis]|uniref:G-protein alpha subunit n=1 Tax=Crepidotus variabilis TaxID=179855 RepID=A0A9P6EDM0_9AGAR|nr:G-protein alpha subunit [Crepidotus variabilis]